MNTIEVLKELLEEKENLLKMDFIKENKAVVEELIKRIQKQIAALTVAIQVLENLKN